MSPVPLAQATLLTRRPELRHGFTSREGGVSTGPLASLNLAARPGEPAEHLEENWRRALHALDPALTTRDLATLQQVHGGEVVQVGVGQGPARPLAEADGAWTLAVRVPLAVRVADCAPVLIAGPGVVGVAHAGWRGAVAGVVTRTVLAMAEAVSEHPSAFVAAIGPCIGPAAFEVGDEVVAAFRGASLPDAAFLVAPPGGGRPHVDLAGAIRFQLARIGVGEVWVDGRCTTKSSELWSHRRDGAGGGRMAGVIARMA